MNYRAVPYHKDFKTDWDVFIEKSANGNFLHKRNYMDYHAHRFTDASLLIYQDEKLKAVFPAHRKDQQVFSHQGLTYGDFIFAHPTRIAYQIAIIKTAVSYYQSKGFEQIFIKTVPWFLQPHPSESSNYIYFQTGAQLHYLKPFFVLKTNDYQLNKDRKKNLKKLQKSNYEMVEGMQFLPDFWKIVTKNLALTHQTQPVHSLKEMQGLMQKFPDEIKLYVTRDADKIINGALLYVFKNSLHFQYIHAHPALGKQSVDWLVYQLIEKYKPFYEYISFGSSEEGSNQLNKGLSYWKESFGCRIFNQHAYTLDISRKLHLNHLI